MARLFAILRGRPVDRCKAGATPEQSLAVYRQVLLDKVKDPNLSLYTQQTRQFLSAWVVTDAQQDNALHSLREATIDQVLVSGNRAVIRFPLPQRTHPPYAAHATFSQRRTYLQTGRPLSAKRPHENKQILLLLTSILLICILVIPVFSL
jgi:hypothetical protein